MRLGCAAFGDPVWRRVCNCELDEPAPHIVGAMAYDVLVRLDIDPEVICDIPDIAASFSVMADLAQLPDVRRVRFANALDEPDQGLYWQVRYRDQDSQPVMDWTIDIWLLPNDHPGPRSLDLVGPMLAVMTPEIRLAILRLKEHFRDQPSVHGIDTYRAVIEGHVRTVASFERWMSENHNPGTADWRPEPVPS